MTVLVGVAGALMLYAAFPARTLEYHLLHERRTDPVLGLLLRAIARTEPSSEQLRLRLVRRHIVEGQLELAEAALRTLLGSSDRALRVEALRLQFEVLERKLVALPATSDVRQPLLAELRALTAAMRSERIKVPSFAEALRYAPSVSGASSVAQTSLAVAQESDDAVQLAEAARLLLGEGKHLLAAAAYTEAMTRSKTRTDRRRYLLEALKTLQAASRFDEAFALAENEGKAHLVDIRIVEFLVRLARAANRPELAEKYARIMLRLSQAPTRPLLERIVGLIVADAMAAEDESLEVNLPFDEERYFLAFEAFLGNRNVRAARLLAAEAVRRVPKDPKWRKRYAQVSEWDGQPRVALEQWLALAEQSDADEAWDAVRRLAPALYDHESYLKVLLRQLKAKPSDFKRVGAVVELYEQLGRPEAGIELLRDYVARTPSREALVRLAQLAERMGRDRLALETLEAVVARFGIDVETALKQAIIAYTLSDAKAAWEYLLRAQGVATPEDLEFWRTFGSLAQLVARFEEAIAGYRILAERTQADDKDFAALINVLQGRHPAEAARMAELGYERFGRRDWLIAALQTHSDKRDWTAFQRAMLRVRAADLAYFEESVAFLLLRAAYFQATGADNLALRDFTRALELSPNDRNVRQALLWMLIGARRLDLLKPFLARWSEAAEQTRELWAPFAAAHVLLQDPRRALRYYRKLVGRDDSDYLLLLAYASALEQASEPDRAWQVRRHVWTKLRDPEVIARERDPSRANELKRGFARLAINFAPGDGAARLIGDLLRVEDGAKRDPAVKELALAWLLAVDATDAAYAWYLRQYAKDLASSRDRPYWAMLSIALARDDRAAIEKLLDQQADLLPLLDRAEAAERVGRIPATQSLAWEMLKRFPANDSAHERYTGLAMQATDRARLETRRLAFGAFRFNEQSARFAHQVDGRIRLGLDIAHRSPRGTDPTVLVYVPSRDNQIEGSVRLATKHGAYGFRLSRRHAFAAVTGFRVDWAQQSERWGLRASAGRNQPALETTPLRIAGMKDSVDAALTYRITRHNHVNAAVQLDRFYSQNRIKLGTGSVGTLDFSHYFRLEYPNLAVRAFVARNRFSTTGAVDESLAGLAPDRDPLPPEFLVPRSYSLRGIGIGFGEGLREEYTRAVRPFADLSFTRNSLLGTGRGLRLGLAGSVFGRDHLALYLSHSRGTRGTNDVFREVGLAYWW
jgi:hypothetical protein